MNCYSLTLKLSDCTIKASVKCVIPKVGVKFPGVGLESCKIPLKIKKKNYKCIYHLLLETNTKIDGFHVQFRTIQTENVATRPQSGKCLER